MKRVKNEVRKLCNRGLSLVELVCAMAILSIIGLTVGGILVVSAQSYDTGMNEVELQQEAQMVVNQISDLIIDTTATESVTFDGAVLTIPEGAKKHYVKYDSATQNLYYACDGGDIAGDQLMATGITAFNADTASFQDSGNLYLDIGLERISNGKPREFQATFQITSRNGVVDTTPAASIDVIDDVVLEPNQTYEFHPVVVGITNQEVSWEFVGGNTDSDTKMVNNTITIGKAEKGSIIHLLVKTKTVDADGNPMAMRAVRVRIRRVNGISVNQISVSGTEFKKDTVYTFTADLNGTYLEQEPWDWDKDYVSPYGMEVSFVSKTPSTLLNPTISDLTVDALNPTRVSFTVKLNSDMEKGAELHFKISAKHPIGANKTASLYDDTVWEPFEICNIGFLTPEHGMARGSNDPLASFDISALKSLLISKFGNGNYQLMRYYRFREQGSGDAGWTKWFNDKDDGPLGFGFDAGNSVNMRPKFGLMMRYGKIYDIQVKMCMINQDTNEVVWPFADTPQSQYMIEGPMDRVRLVFQSTQLGFSNANGLDASKNAKVSQYFNGTLFTLQDLYSLGGSDKGQFYNDVNYTLEKKEGSDWKKIKDLQNGSECRLELNNLKCGTGEYRIKVWMYERHVKYENGNVTTIQNDPNYVYDVWKMGNGEGLFYFTVVE